MRTSALGVVIGILLSLLAAMLLHFPWPLGIGWGMFSGGLAGLSLDKTRSKGNRVFYGVLAALVVATGIWWLANRGGA